MSGGRGETQPAAGGPASHIPVLLDACLDALDARAGRVYLDGTFGAGGYSRALLARGARVIGLDRDPNAIAGGAGLVAASEGKLTLVRGRFGELDKIARDLGFEKLDGVVLDIGVSSMQLDEGERGFSLRFDAPLDMRMEGEGRSAADILIEEDEATLADIFYRYGEERASRRIARAIVADRVTAPYTTTLQLARMIQRVAPARPGEFTHPATRTFQALRIAVNDELGQLLQRPRRRRAHPGAGRTARGGHVSFARGSHRQAVPRAPLRPRRGRVASAAGRACAGGAELSRRLGTADRARR